VSAFIVMATPEVNDFLESATRLTIYVGVNSAGCSVPRRGKVSSGSGRRINVQPSAGGIGETLPEADPSYQIRKCVDGDLDGVLKIEEESFPDPYDREIFSQLLSSEPEGFLVAEGGPGVLGYVASSARYGIIFSLAVSASRRREGIGRALMDAILRYLSEETEWVSLQVRVGNSAAIGLYRQFSFREEGRVRRYYPDGEDALVMILDFKSS